MNLLKKHEFWACAALISMLMCMLTGHRMVSGKRRPSKEETEE